MPTFNAFGKFFPERDGAVVRQIVDQPVGENLHTSAVSGAADCRRG